MKPTEPLSQQAAEKPPGAVSNPPVPPKASSLLGHNATALLPHRFSFRRSIRARSGHRGFFPQPVINKLEREATYYRIVPHRVPSRHFRRYPDRRPRIFIQRQRSMSRPDINASGKSLTTTAGAAQIVRGTKCYGAGDCAAVGTPNNYA